MVEFGQTDAMPPLLQLLLLALQLALGAAARVQYLTLFSSHQQVCPGRVLHVRVNYAASDARPTDGISFRVSWDTRFFTLVKKVRGHGAGYGECEMNDFAHRRPSTQLDRHEWVQYVCADHRTRTSVSAKNVLPGTVQGVVQLTLVSRPDMPAGTKTQIKLVPGRLHGSGYEIVAQKPLVIEAKSGRCSTDCEVSEFAEWSACTAKCGGGLRTRSRQVLQRAQGSGKACPPAWETAYCNQHRCDDLEVGSSVKSEPCLVGPWQPWRQCSNTCGGGLQHRTREVVLHGTPGAVCPRLHHARVCNTPMCPPSYEGWGGKQCERPDGKFVPHGWLGAGTGDNYCNLCDCSNGSYECQKKRCAPVRNKQGACSHVSCHWRDGKMPKRVRLITGRLDTEGGLRFHTVINVRHSSAETAGTHQNCAANKGQMTCACSCTGDAANPSIWKGAAATPPPQKAMLLSAPSPSPTPVPTYPRITTPGHKGAVTKLPATSADDDALDTGVFESSVAPDEMPGQAGMLAATKPPTPIAYMPAHAGSVVSSKLDDFDDEADQPLDLISPTPTPEAVRRPTINQKIKIDTTAIIVPEHKKPEVALEQDFVDEQGDDGGLDNLAAINIPSNP